MMNLNENDLISGLSFFVGLSGGFYPSKLNTETTIKGINELGSQNLQDMS